MVSVSLCVYFCILNAFFFCGINHDICNRYTSRAMLIPFNLPTVGPTNQQGAEYFEQLSQKMTKVSSAVGWAISLGKDSRDGRQFDNDRLERVRTKLLGVEPRLCTAYTTLFFAVEKVGCFVLDSTPILLMISNLYVDT